MDQDDRETFTAAVRGLINTADDEPQPDTILVRDTPEMREAAERLHAMRPQGEHAFRTVEAPGGHWTDTWLLRSIKARARLKVARAVEDYRTPQQIFDRADYSKLTGKRFDFALLIPPARFSREGVKTYQVQRVDDRWTVSNEGKSEEQFWLGIDDAISSEPEIVEVQVASPFRISAATLAFCLGGCILHGAPPKKA